MRKITGIEDHMLSKLNVPPIQIVKQALDAVARQFLEENNCELVPATPREDYCNFLGEAFWIRAVSFDKPHVYADGFNGQCNWNTLTPRNIPRPHIFRIQGWREYDYSLHAIGWQHIGSLGPRLQTTENPEQTVDVSRFNSQIRSHVYVDR